MKKIFVGGAGGFIGGHLVKHLLGQGHHVVAVDIKPLHEWFQVCDDAHNYVANLEHLEACLHLTQGCELIYNLACNMGGMGFIANHRALCMQSVLINTHLLMAAKANDISKYFYASSACVYPDYRQGNTNVTALKESDAFPAMPEAGYGWEKLFSEQMCKYYREDFGIQTQVFRFHNVYGPHGAWEGGREKAPAALCRKIIEAKKNGTYEIDVWGDGNQTRSFMYIDDCIKGLELLMESDYTEPLNLGSSELVSVNQLIEIIENIAGIKVQKNYNLDAPQGVRGRNSDNTLIREVLHWEPSIALKTGMKETYDWIHNQMYPKKVVQNTQQKVILWNPGKYDFGLGDRIRGIAGGIVFAEELEAKLLIGAPPSEACPVDLNDLYESGENFVTFPELIETKQYKNNPSYNVIAEWNHKINYGPNKHYDHLQEYAPLDISHEEFKDRWKNVIQRFRPMASTLGEIQRLQSQMHPKILGVHLRRTDVLQCKSKAITPENLEAYDMALWEKILELIEGKSYTQVFLASDDRGYFEAWKQRLLDIGIEVLHFDQNWSGEFRQTSLDGVVIDMHMMASCDQVIGSVPSSLFTVGRALGGRYGIIKPLNN